MAPKWKSSIPIAGVAAAAALAFPGIANATVTSAVVNGTELTVTSDAADAITIASNGATATVNGAPVGGATAATLTKITVTGTGAFNNTFDLTGVTKVAFPALVAPSAVTLNGGPGNDTITGSERPDVMNGGDGNDRLIGDNNDAGTRDVANGEGGDDTMVWNPGDGDDTNEGGPGSDVVEVNGGGNEDFTVKPSATPGRVAFDRTGPTPPGPFNLDIGTSEKLDFNGRAGNDTLLADGGLAALGFALDLSGGDGDDTLVGDDGVDLIAGDAGNDTITLDDNPAGTRETALGGDGDDTMIWNGGDDDDRNDGGPGNDTVTVNGANADEAFTLNASATPGEARFERAATPGPGPFNIDITASERLDLKANAGNDTFSSAGAIAALGLRADVQGGDGTDTLDGSDAADTLDGGTGNDRIVPDDNPAGTRDDARGGDGDDVIVWNGGDDDDLNEGGAGNDTSEVNGADADEKFTIKPSAAAGRVLFDRLAAPGPGAFSVDIGTTESLQARGQRRQRPDQGVEGRRRADQDDPRCRRRQRPGHRHRCDRRDQPRQGLGHRQRDRQGRGHGVLRPGDRPGARGPARLRAPVRARDRRAPARRDQGQAGAGGQQGRAAPEVRRHREVQERRQAQAQRQAHGRREGHAQARQDHDGGRRPQPPRPPRPLRRRPREGPGRVEGQAGQRLADGQDRPARLAHHPRVPGGPLNGPARSAVIQPP